jgi:hypothetical protein
MRSFRELSEINDKIEYYHFRKLFNLLLGFDVDVYKQLGGYSYDNKYDVTINDQKIYIYNKNDNNYNNNYKITTSQLDIESVDNKKILYYILNPENDTTIAFLVINKQKNKAYISMIYGDYAAYTYYEKKNQIGTLLLQYIIELCKQNSIKEIYLNDESTYHCNKPEIKYKISLFKANTLIEGYPWYYNFGFIYRDDREDNMILFNQELHSSVLTKDLSELQINFMELIKNVLSDKNKYKEIKVLFNDYQDKTFGSLCKVLSEKHSEIFYNIYEDIFEKIGYKYIDKAFMILDLE